MSMVTTVAPAPAPAAAPRGADEAASSADDYAEVAARVAAAADGLDVDADPTEDGPGEDEVADADVETSPAPIAPPLALVAAEVVTLAAVPLPAPEPVAPPEGTVADAAVLTPTAAAPPADVVATAEPPALDASTPGDVGASSRQTSHEAAVASTPASPSASAAPAPPVAPAPAATATSTDSASVEDAAPPVPSPVAASTEPVTAAPVDEAGATSTAAVADGALTAAGPATTTDLSAPAAPVIPAGPGASNPTPPNDVTLTAATAPAGSAPGAAAEPDPWEQLAAVVRPLRTAPDGSHRLALQLRPAELGTVHLEVAVDDGRLSVRAVAENASSRDLLAAALPQLRAELTASGVDLGTLDVGEGTTGGTERHDAGPDTRGRGSSTGRPLVGGPATTPILSDTVAPSSPRRTDAGRVDLAL